MRTSKPICKQGFTLIEVAIVLVVIGFVVGGILIGNSLIATSKVQAFTKQNGQLDSAVRNFETRYRSVPGDTNLLTPAGDGDGKVEDFFAASQDPEFNGKGVTWHQGNGELPNFWKHLSESGVKSRSGVDFTNNMVNDQLQTDLTSTTVPNMPGVEMAAKGTGIIVTNDNGPLTGMGIQGAYVIGVVTGITAPGDIDFANLGAAFNGQQLAAIDSKQDDGAANSGDIRAFVGGTSTEATTYDTASSAPAYTAAIKYLKLSNTKKIGESEGGGDSSSSSSSSGGEACPPDPGNCGAAPNCGVYDDTPGVCACVQNVCDESACEELDTGTCGCVSTCSDGRSCDGGGICVLQCDTNNCQVDMGGSSCEDLCDSGTQDCDGNGQCVNRPVCGDTVCDSGIESCFHSGTGQGCEADCGTCSCGDGTCNSESGEDASNCAQDCGDGEYCGDGTCNGGETAYNRNDSTGCPQDCGYYCGDNYCDSSAEYGGTPEDSMNCSQDCSNDCGCGENMTCYSDPGGCSGSGNWDMCNNSCDCSYSGGSWDGSYCQTDCGCGMGMSCYSDPGGCSGNGNWDMCNNSCDCSYYGGSWNGSYCDAGISCDSYNNCEYDAGGYCASSCNGDQYCSAGSCYDNGVSCDSYNNCEYDAGGYCASSCNGDQYCSAGSCYDNAYCGDGNCSGEDPGSCPQDCGYSCGDGYCSSGYEDGGNCCTDCGGCGVSCDWNSCEYDAGGYCASSCNWDQYCSAGSCYDNGVSCDSYNNCEYDAGGYCASSCTMDQYCSAGSCYDNGVSCDWNNCEQDMGGYCGSWCGWDQYCSAGSCYDNGGGCTNYDPGWCGTLGGSWDDCMGYCSGYYDAESYCSANWGTDCSTVCQNNGWGNYWDGSTSCQW